MDHSASLLIAGAIAQRIPFCALVSRVPLRMGPGVGPGPVLAQGAADRTKQFYYCQVSTICAPELAFRKSHSVQWSEGLGAGAAVEPGGGTGGMTGAHSCQL